MTCEDVGHYVVEVEVRAQLGDGFRPFDSMRRRRNELKNPSEPGQTTTTDEAIDAVNAEPALLIAGHKPA